MKRSELEYDLPPELIAQQPAECRDASRLLVLDRATGRIEHRTFRDVLDYLNPGDGLVLNDTRVIPARFFAHRVTGARVEGLFLHEDGNRWRVLLKPSNRLKEGERLLCDGAEAGLWLDMRCERGEWIVRPDPSTSVLDLLTKIGHTPLPPYIHRDQETPDEQTEADIARYQTVFAKRPGAVAAPTAGLHFTPELLNVAEARGVRRAEVTLHVGPGTFTPITVDDLGAHPMHAEWYEVVPETAANLRSVRSDGGRLIAVGTTATRVLESLAASGSSEDGLAPGSGWTDIFIYSPYTFRNVDALVTNFHLPGSTLLALVMALATPELIRAAYAAAIEERYRFYSYGDAMLIV